jgi:hypothetical protein
MKENTRKGESRVISNLLINCNVYLSAQSRLSHHCVPSGPLHETPILLGRETEGPLVAPPHPRAHRVHNVARRHAASQTTTAPRRAHRNNACAPHIPEPQARHARERPPPQHLCAGASRHDGRRDALRIRQGASVVRDSGPRRVLSSIFIFLAYGRTGLGHLLLGHGEADTA